MSKGSKRREEDYSSVISNWDNIDWSSKKEKKENPKEKDLTKPFGNDITYYEDRN